MRMFKGVGSKYISEKSEILRYQIVTSQIQYWSSLWQGATSQSMLILTSRKN